MNADDIAQNYVLLGLQIDRHFPGYVDAYFGPPEMRRQVEEAAPRDPGDLRREVEGLLDALPGADLDLQRCRFLTGQLVAMRTALRRLGGEELSFQEEAQANFGVAPERLDEAAFEAALGELEELLPGDAPLMDRLTAWKKRLDLPPDHVLPALELARQETRRRTLALLDLPDGEEVTLEIVQDKPWSAYNWYLGEYRSRIEVNTDLPVRASAVVDLMAHEAYPGHHTEHVIKEQHLYRDDGRLEHSIFLLNTPECLVAEGIASVAREVVFPDDELVGWLRDELYPAAGIEGVDAELQVRIDRASEQLRGVSGNAAFLLHQDGHSEDEVLACLQRYGLRTEKEARQSLKFLTNPLFRTYIFTYYYGRDLMRRAFARHGVETVFRRAVSEPITPGELGEWGEKNADQQD